MSRILFAWELGEGLGHVTNIRPVAIALQDRGHDVIVATRNIRSAATAFDGTSVHFVPCPHQNWRMASRIRRIVSYAHMLHCVGFGDQNGLTALVGSWRTMYDLIRPDLIVFDHSPTGLLAARGTGIARATLGSGFFSPPDVKPLPCLRPEIAVPQEQLESDENDVLDIANSVLEALDAPLLSSLSRLFSEVELTLLSTYAELDHFGERPQQRYWGVHTVCPAKPPQWPTGEGGRIFAYLKPVPVLNDIILELGRRANPVIVYGPWVDEEAKRRISYPNMRLSSVPVDIEQTAAECDLAILNGTHATTAQMLRRGVPVLQLPIFVEQAIVAQRTVQMGAGILRAPVKNASIGEDINRMLSDSSFSDAAGVFARRYPGPWDDDFHELVELIAAQLL